MPVLTGPITSQPPSSLKSVENEAVHDGGGTKVAVRGPRDIMEVLNEMAAWGL